MGEDRGSGGGQIEDFLAFRCNYCGQDGKACSVILNEAFVTGCSHLFCAQHAKEWFGANDDCPICRNGSARLLHVDLSQAASKKRRFMSLVGMTPPEIMQASETALNFWLDQKVFEFQMGAKRQGVLADRYQKTEELVKARLVEAEHACNGLQEERRLLEQRIEEAERDNSKATEQLRELERELSAAEEEHHSLHSRVSHGDDKAFFRRPLPVTSPVPASGNGGSARRSDQGAGGTAGRGMQEERRGAGKSPGQVRQLWHSDEPSSRQGSFFPRQGGGQAVNEPSDDRNGGGSGGARRDRDDGGRVGIDERSRHRQGHLSNRRPEAYATTTGSLGAALGSSSSTGGPCAAAGVSGAGIAGIAGMRTRRLPTFTPGMSYAANRFSSKKRGLH